MLFGELNKIGKDIYVIPNFVAEEEIAQINNYLDNLNEEDWISEEFVDTTEPIDSVEKIRKRIESIIPENLYIGFGSSVIRMKKGKSWGEHTDMYEFKEIQANSLNYVEGSPYEEKYIPVYGAVVYFNKFSGGEIYYPNQNITYKPNPGDLIIHGSEDSCLHGVKEVLSENRYTYTNLIYKKVRVPA